MATKAPTRKELAQILVETYLQVCGTAEFLRQIAMSEMFKKYEKDFTPRQRKIWRDYELEKPLNQRSYVK